MFMIASTKQKGLQSSLVIGRQRDTEREREREREEAKSTVLRVTNSHCRILPNWGYVQVRVSDHNKTVRELSQTTLFLFPGFFPVS